MQDTIALDHIGAMVRDIEAGADAWRRLGFVLSRRSPQMGFTGPGGALETWATANHCAVFRRGYLELIGVVDPARFNPWARFLDRYEGVHITAFRCPVADAAYAALAERVEGFDPPVARKRDAPWGASETREMRFRNIFSRDDAWPEGRFIVIEHQTPEVLWQEALMEHPNGARAFLEAFLCADDPAPTARRLGRLLDVEPESPAPGELLFRASGGGALRLFDPAALARRFPGAVPPASPCMIGGAVAFADPAAAAGLMRAAGAAPEQTQGRLWVRPEHANGTLIEIRPDEG